MRNSCSTRNTKGRSNDPSMPLVGLKSSLVWVWKDSLLLLSVWKLLEVGYFQRYKVFCKFAFTITNCFSLFFTTANIRNGVYWTHPPLESSVTFIKSQWTSEIHPCSTFFFTFWVLLHGRGDNVELSKHKVMLPLGVRSWNVSAKTPSYP